MSLLPRGSRSSLAAALAALACTLSAPAQAIDDDALRAELQTRLRGDRTGACIAVAVIEREDKAERVSRAYACADGGDPARRIGPDTAFEIGSVSKTMLAALLAQSILDGKASLDDPLSAHLPDGTKVPRFGAADGDAKDAQGQILLRHIVTHTSGLPSIPPALLPAMRDPADPYAAIDTDTLLAALARTPPARAPGSQFEYSNFATMLLSHAVSRRAGAPLHTLLRERVFAPLEMSGAYLDAGRDDGRPDGVRAAQGHLPNGKPTSAWHFRDDLGGVGGVRARLDDMVRYVQGQLGDAPAPLREALRLSQARVTVEGAGARPMAMHWMLAGDPARPLHVHEGGTGGFSSLVAFDVAAQRGVVVLSDTALHSLGGLGDIGLPLLAGKPMSGKPRKATKAPAELIDALVGDYRFNGLPTVLRRRGDALEIQVQGQPAFVLGYDDAGDFYPTEFDALLTPQRGPDGRMRFGWRQGGGLVMAERAAAKGTADDGGKSAPVLKAEQAQAYVGEYPLTERFVLTVRAEGAQLTAQATGQGAFPLTPVAEDVFEFAPAGIVIRYERDAARAITALVLEQGGTSRRAPRR
jgi:CubicO group peptidase (beta-lactamase class C family)